MESCASWPVMPTHVGAWVSLGGHGRHPMFSHPRLPGAIVLVNLQSTIVFACIGTAHVLLDSQSLRGTTPRSPSHPNRPHHCRLLLPKYDANSVAIFSTPTPFEEGWGRKKSKPNLHKVLLLEVPLLPPCPPSPKQLRCSGFLTGVLRAISGCLGVVVGAS